MAKKVKIAESVKLENMIIRYINIVLLTIYEESVIMNIGLNFFKKGAVSLMATKEKETGDYENDVESYRIKALEVLKREGESVFMAKAKEPEGHPELKKAFPRL